MSRAAGPSACPAQRRRLARLGGREGGGGVDEGGAGSREIREDWVRSISPSNAGRKRGRGDEGGWVSPSNAAPARRVPARAPAGQAAARLSWGCGQENGEEGRRGRRGVAVSPSNAAPGRRAL